MNHDLAHEIQKSQDALRESQCGKPFEYAFDDITDIAEWHTRIGRLNEWALGEGPGEDRRRSLVRVAATAASAIESYDRINGQSDPVTYLSNMVEGEVLSSEEFERELRAELQRQLPIKHVVGRIRAMVDAQDKKSGLPESKAVKGGWDAYVETLMGRATQRIQRTYVKPNNTPPMSELVKSPAALASLMADLAKYPEGRAAMRAAVAKLPPEPEQQ